MPVMAELGYEGSNTAHNAMIRELQDRMPIPVSEVVKGVAAIYKKLYGLSPIQINRGTCENFAYDLKAVLGDGEVYWADEMPDGSWDEHGAHAFLEYQGRYYDSQEPDGVDNWQHLPFFM